MAFFGRLSPYDERLLVHRAPRWHEHVANVLPTPASSGDGLAGGGCQGIVRPGSGHHSRFVSLRRHIGMLLLAQGHAEEARLLLAPLHHDLEAGVQQGRDAARSRVTRCGVRVS
ncbi:hypothetical protein WBG99_29505 [Streptomyces sp. TG1A-60]|uniref:hypothetical protein n=1 Tax=Streptomyces sp. TG1A-60 TaxID=3129111 RepID=UPI0030CCAFEB